MAADPSARFGTVERKDGVHELRYERRLEHPVEEVWAALTEPERIIGWLAAAERLELREGGRIELRWQNVPDDISEWEEHGVELDAGVDPSAPVRGTITELDPPRLLAYETDLMGSMRFELRSAGEGCVLTFTNEVVGLADAQGAQTLAGWHLHLDQLERALAGERAEWSTWTEDQMEGWKRLRDHYAAAG